MLPLPFDHNLTGVKDPGVDPALSEADGHPAAGIGEQDFGAAGPGSRRHTVGVVTAPVPHQHAIIISGIELNTVKFQKEADLSSQKFVTLM